MVKMYAYGLIYYMFSLNIHIIMIGSLCELCMVICCVMLCENSNWIFLLGFV